MFVLEVDRQGLGRRGDDRLELVSQRPARRGVRLAQLVDEHDLALKMVTELRLEALVVDQPTVAHVRAAHRPDERCPHAVLAAALVAAVQHGVVDLDRRVLELVGHHVPQVLQQALVRHQQAAMLQPPGRVTTGYDRGPGIAPAVRQRVAAVRHQHALAGGIGDARDRRRAHRLPVLVKADRRLDPAPAVDAIALDVPEQRVEGRAADFAAVLQIKEAVFYLDVGEPLIPFALLDPAQLLAGDLGDHVVRVLGKEGGWRQRRLHPLHLLGQQVVTQAGGGVRPAVLMDPVEEHLRRQRLTVAVMATEHPVQRTVACLDGAVGVLVLVRTDDRQPAGVVDAAKDHALIRQPFQDDVVARVREPQRDVGGGVGLVGHDVKGGADLLQGELTLRVELDQPGSERLATGLEVDRAGNTEVAHRVGRAGVGVARLGDRLDRGDERGLGWLIGKSVTPLKRAGRRLHNPRRLQRRALGLGANIVEHHAQDELAVGLRGADAGRHAVEDERAGVEIGCGARFHAL